MSTTDNRGAAEVPRSNPDPRAVALSFAAYAGFQTRNPTVAREQLDAVLGALPWNWELEWGPGLHAGAGEVFPDASAFVVRERDAENRWLVIRGTNPVSLSSWLVQDAWTGYQLPWGDQAPANARVSLGAAVTRDTLLSLREGVDTPQHGTRLVDYLQTVTDAPLTVTGHSLGGGAAPLFALWLTERIGYFGDNPANVIALAGPSVGNPDFNAYLRNTVAGSDPSRLQLWANDMDVVPNAWDPARLESLKEKYARCLDHGPFDRLVDAAVNLTESGGYQTLSEQSPIQSEFCSWLPLWGLQLVYQHVFPYIGTLEGWPHARDLGGIVAIASRAGAERLRPEWLAGRVTDHLSRSPAPAAEWASLFEIVLRLTGGLVSWAH